MRLNRKQLEAISSAFASLGNIVFVSMVASWFFPERLEQLQTSMIVLGLIVWALCHTAGVLVLTAWRGER